MRFNLLFGLIGHFSLLKDVKIYFILCSEKALCEIILNWLFYQHNSSGYLSEKTIFSGLCWTMYEGQHKDLQEKNVSSLHSITPRIFQKVGVFDVLINESMNVDSVSLVFCVLFQKVGVFEVLSNDGA